MSITKKIGLYIHIPFCIKRCNYCSFNSSVYNSEIASEYIEALKKEIEFNKCDRKLTSIYIGGGTPTILSLKHLEELCVSIKNNFSYDNIEFTMEANPGTLNKEKLLLLKQLGVNRLSLGVQAFQDNLLKLLGRAHSAQEIYKSYEFAREVDFENINLDIIFAIPSQTQKDWEETLNNAVKLDPDHISIYNLMYEPKTIITQQVKIGKIIPLSSDDEFTQYRFGINFLKNHKLKQYEISNFCKKDKECAHNILYWTGHEYLGLGAGAVSCINNKRYKKNSDISKYIKKINENKNSISSKELLTKEIQIKENIMLNLRLIKGLNKNEFMKRFDIRIEDLFGEKIKELVSKKLLLDFPERIKLTKNGVYLNNEVLVEFM